MQEQAGCACLLLFLQDRRHLLCYGKHPAHQVEQYRCWRPDAKRKEYAGSTFAGRLAISITFTYFLLCLDLGDKSMVVYSRRKQELNIEMGPGVTVLSESFTCNEARDCLRSLYLTLSRHDLANNKSADLYLID